MNVSVTIKYVRIAPRKVHRVIREIVGKKVTDARTVLKFLPHHSASILNKVLQSAISNAVHNYKLAEQDFVVAEGFVGPALMMKRFTPMSRGRAGAIQKKFSHITITLKEGSHNGPKN